MTQKYEKSALVTAKVLLKTKNGGLPLKILLLVPGPEKYGERGNGVPRKVGLPGSSGQLDWKTLKVIQKIPMVNQPNEGLRRYTVDFSQKTNSSKYVFE